MSYSVDSPAASAAATPPSSKVTRAATLEFATWRLVTTIASEAHASMTKPAARSPVSGPAPPPSAP